LKGPLYCKRATSPTARRAPADRPCQKSLCAGRRFERTPSLGQSAEPRKRPLDTSYERTTKARRTILRHMVPHRTRRSQAATRRKNTTQRNIKRAGFIIRIIIIIIIIIKSRSFEGIRRTRRDGKESRQISHLMRTQKAQEREREVAGGGCVSQARLFQDTLRRQQVRDVAGQI